MLVEVFPFFLLFLFINSYVCHKSDRFCLFGTPCDTDETHLTAESWYNLEVFHKSDVTSSVSVVRVFTYV
jgi:hypothetical protein